MTLGRPLTREPLTRRPQFCGFRRGAPSASAEGERVRRPSVRIVSLSILIAGLIHLAGVGPTPLHQARASTPGQPFAWGLNGNGQVGDGTSGNARTAPV